MLLYHKFRFQIASFVILLCVVFISPGNANDAFRDRMSDTWVAMDALGRELPMGETCGPPKEDRTVAMFYFLWVRSVEKLGPFDLSKILKENPENPQYGPKGSFHHWSEPELGYYVQEDPYVIRKHCHMLINAGIDVLVFDVTNALTYPEVYLAICREFDRIRALGEKTPQISFITNSRHERTVKKLYDEFYAKRLHSDLWFRWQGKPLLMASPEGHDAEVSAFFTFRHSWAWTKGHAWFGDGKDKWPWLDHYPQNPGWHESPDKPEQIAVGVAQHPVSNIGRSFHDGRQPAPGQQKTEQGWYFQEQWRRALEVDPPVVFVTGWNEWVAQRSLNTGNLSMMGHKLAKGDTFFVDLFTPEYSRDIEPMKGGHGDAYYWQLVANVRRYKGVRPVPLASAAKSIMLDGAFADWAEVGPEFRDAIGDTLHRDFQGFANAGPYRDNSGRNDFVTLKVARDARNFYFYAQTCAPITTPHAENWMLLFLDTDSNPRTGGWNGYEFFVRPNPDKKGEAQLMRFGAGAVATVMLHTQGNELEMSIPRKALDMEGAKTGSLDFHWADNIKKIGEIKDFALHGDSAPDRRFNYRYRFGE